MECALRAERPQSQHCCKPRLMQWHRRFYGIMRTLFHAFKQSRLRRPGRVQINCSYYSAVGDRDDWYILARALQLFTPGIPLIYYVGLMAGRNDLELVEQTKTGRDINRHPYTLDEAVSEAERPVVKVRTYACHACIEAPGVVRA